MTNISQNIYNDTHDYFSLKYSERSDNYTSSFVKHLMDNNFLVNYINQSLKEKRIYDNIKKNSYRHQNGFLKIGLLNQNGENIGWRLRIHIWNSQGEKLQSNIHDHAWDFYSLILSGKLRTCIYEESENGTEYFHHEYKNDPISYKSSLKFQKKIKLQLVENSIKSKGDIYRLKNTDIHKTIVNMSDPLITLFFQFPAKRLFSNVYLPIVNEYDNQIGKSNSLIEDENLMDALNLIQTVIC